MAALNRGSLTDDDSISEHLGVTMVRIIAPSTSRPTDPDDQTILEDSAGLFSSCGTNNPDTLNLTNPNLVDGSQHEYEVPNLFTYRKVNHDRFYS